jgi:hypothetical protein
VNRYDSVYVYGDTDKDHTYGTWGIDSVTWGGAAGTRWNYYPEDDLAISIQSNVADSGKQIYLHMRIAGVVQDHTY